MAETVTEEQFKLAWALLCYINEGSEDSPAYWMDLILYERGAEERIMRVINFILGTTDLDFDTIDDEMDFEQFWALDVEEYRPRYWYELARREYQTWFSNTAVSADS